MNDPLCGIDLGTTNSSIASLEEGKPIPLPVDDGSSIVPSVVSLDEATGDFIVGRVARNRLGAFPDSTVRSIKRLMGREAKVTLGEKTFSPEEISSFILGYLARGASRILGREVRRAVITVPAYFNDAQRRATIKAGELAGLEVTRIVNEPTAASLVYDYASVSRSSESPYIMVYDLGGGTFDVSIIEVKGEIKEVMASTGDTALGGDDFDERLADFLRRSVLEKSGIDLRGRGRALDFRLKDIAERAKIALSDQPYVQVSEAALATVEGAPVNLEVELRRLDYEELIGDLVEKTVRKVKEALDEAKLRPGDISEIILVGGATRTPVVQATLQEIFERPIQHSIDPDLCVALGACVQSGLIAGEPLGHILLDVTAHSLGVKTIDEIDPETGDADHFSVIIRRNTRIPTRKAEAYRTIANNQPGVEVEVYQGESSSCRENTPTGNFYFPLNPAPRGSPVTVEFAYDREGIVHITVDQRGTGNRKEVTLDVRGRKILDISRDMRDMEEIAAAGAGMPREAAAPPASLEVAGEQKVLNYIIEKARRLAGREGIPENMRDELNDLRCAYESALKSGEDDRAIDGIEEKLLSKIEEVEGAS